MARDAQLSALGRSHANTDVILPAQAAASAREERTWEVDVFPMPGNLCDDDGRPISAVLVVGGRFALAARVDAGLPSEPGDVVPIMADALASAARAVGGWPRRVCVRHSALVAPLAAAMEPAPVVVERRLPLADIAAARSSLLRDMRHGRGEGEPIPGGCPVSFGGWGLSEQIASDLFAAAAQYRELAPWRWIENAQPLYAELESGRRVWCVVLGNAGIERGISVYDHARDIATATRLDEEGEYDRLEGGVVTLSFDAPDELDEDYVREVKEHGWQVAGSREIPRVFTVNTLGGGLSQGAAEDLTRLLRSVPRFVEEQRPLLRAETAVRKWPRKRDPTTGVTLSYRGFVRFSPDVHWTEPDVVALGVAQGRGAAPERALEGVWLAPEEIEARVETGAEYVDQYWSPFLGWMAAKGIPHEVVSARADDALWFLTFLYLGHRMPLEAVTEFDLRTFLFGTCIQQRGIMGDREVRDLPTSLKELFRFAEQSRGIECPWAAAVLAEREAFEGRQHSYPRDGAGEEALRLWTEVLGADLSSRVMLADGWAGDEDVPAPPSSVERRLAWEVQRLWLLWRDEVIRSGVTERELVRAALLARKRVWEKTPHPRLEGRTPLEVVLAEREGGWRPSSSGR